MRRLTMWYDGNHAICTNEDCTSDGCPFADAPCERVQEVIDRLAAYEDTGLEPEEIKTSMEMFAAYRHVCGGRSPEEIAALAQAQDAGPCGLCRHNPPSSCDGKPCTMCPAEGCIVEEPIVFADGQCPRCGGMTHNYGGAVMRCPD